jgi:predicted permease
MKLWAYLRSLLAKLFHHSDLAAEMDDEVRSHIAHYADDLERSGLSRPEAERRARIEFGARERYKEESYQAMGGAWFHGFLQDFRLSLRTLRKSPGFLIAAVLTLALAIGANAVVFSVLNAFILRPLNVPHSENLFGVWRSAESTMAESYPDYVDLRDRNRSFSDLAAYNISEVGIDTGNNPSRIWIEEATGNYFDALGLQPYLGRYFHASDEHGPNSAPYIVLNYAYWQTHFQGDRNIVGKVVRLDKHPYTIIGVAQPGFHGTLLFFNPDVFVPIVNHPQFGGNGLDDRGDRWVFMSLGHLKPGVSQAQAIADLDRIGEDLARTYPKTDEKMKAFTLARPSLYGDYVGKPMREFLSGLMLLAGMILLAACANLGSLFAARAADRSREVALRLALGSSRRRILRSLFSEALLISLGGGVVGLTMSMVLLHGLSVWQPIARWPLHLSVDPDGKVYLLALLLALLSGVLFGAVPVKQVLRANPYEIVKAGGRGATSRRIGAREILLVVQIAICALLVTSSMVAVRGLARSLRDDFGFDVDHTLLIETDLGMAGYRGDAVAPMQKRMMDAVKAIPGVEALAMADTVPLGIEMNDSNIFTDSTSDLKPSNAAGDAFIYKVSAEYFRAAGTSLLAGRPFTPSENKSQPAVVIVNREFARRIFGSIEKALGAHFKLPDGTRLQVVGIAEDGKYGSLTEHPQLAMFVPILQFPSGGTYMVVSSRKDPQELGTAVRARLRSLDAGLPVYIETRYKALDVMLFGPRMATISLGVLGVLGAILSITGIFGMAAYAVSRRLRELGIRVALGAKRREVLRAALGGAVKLLAFGSSTGLLLGILASPVMAFIVSQATPRDPFVLASVVLAMALLGLIATWIPARRALMVDPMILLREE